MPALDTEVLRLVVTLALGVAPNAAWDGIKTLVQRTLRSDALARAIDDTAAEHQESFPDLKAALTAWSQTAGFESALAVFDEGGVEGEFVEAALPSLVETLALQEFDVSRAASVLRSLYSNLATHTLRSERGLELLDARLGHYTDELLRANEQFRVTQTTTSSLVAELARVAGQLSVHETIPGQTTPPSAFLSSRLRIRRISRGGEAVSVRLGGTVGITPIAGAGSLKVESVTEVDDVAGQLIDIDVRPANSG